QSGAAALSHRAQHEKIADRFGYAQAVRNGSRVEPHLGPLGAFIERTHDRSAVLRLDRNHLRPNAGGLPADTLHLVERFPHANHAGAAARWIDDPVRERPGQLLTELVGHRLLAFDAIRLL